MKKQLFRFPIMILLAFGLFLPPAAGGANAQVAPAPSIALHDNSAGASPQGLLNPDGTLNLESGFSGSLNLSGWDVQIDPQRGPLLSGSEAAADSASPGNWADLGGGGSGALNYEVDAIAVSGTDVYVGGWFVDVDNIPEADYIAKWNGSSWSALGSSGLGNGVLYSSVTSLAVGLSGELYVGGYFSNILNAGVQISEADYVAKWDGANWSALGSDGSGDGAVGGPVYALAVDSLGNLYVGGSFLNVENDGAPIAEADYIAKWDGSDWSAVGNGGVGVGSLNNSVKAIAAAGTNIYVGGWFTDVKNKGVLLDAADYIAKWNGSDWSALGSNPSTGGSLNSAVYDIAVSGSNVYAGGQFTNASNPGGAVTAADYIAKWDGASWSALGSGSCSLGGGSINSTVSAVAVSGSDVYVGGYFVDVCNGAVALQAADRVAKWDGANWSNLGADAGGAGAVPDGMVFALAVSGANVYAGGFFSQVRTSTGILAQATNLAKWNGSAWSALGVAQGSLNARVYAIAVSGTDIYVGGDFTNVVDHGLPIPEADYIARWDGANWHAVGGGGYNGGALNGSVYAIVVSGADVYVGGSFNGIFDGGSYITEAQYIARWDGSSWHALGGNGAGGGSLNSPVRAIAVSGSNVYVGGTFTDVNNYGTGIPEADYIAKWNGSNWSALGNGGSGVGSLNARVLSIALSGSNVYVGGGFCDVKNGGSTLWAADYIAKWDGLNWSALGSNGSGEGSIIGYVHALAVSGSNLYAGGEFINVNDNGTPVNQADHIAKWDGSHWSALGHNGSGHGSINGPVYVIGLNGSSVYVGGDFTDVNNNGTPLYTADYAARWDGSNWSGAGSNGAGEGAIGGPLYATDVRALGVVNGQAYVGGHFFNVNNNGTVLPYADHIAAFGITPQSWTRADFDDSGTSDLSVFRPSTGVWYVKGQFNTTWGAAGDVPLPGDYNGDGHADVAIYRPSTHIFYVKGQFNSAWGVAGDIPVPADYDGNGITDVAVWRPSNGTWYVKGGASTVWGQSGDLPLPGDYDGDNVAELAVWRPSTGVWYVKGLFNTTWGVSTDIPVPGDYDGDGTFEVAVWRPSTGVWYVKGLFNSAWGNATDIPVPGDYNGDSHEEVAVWRPSDGKWYVKAISTTVWGTSGDFPLLAPDTNGDGDPYQ